MTEDEFIASYCKRSGVTWEWLSLRRAALPCACGNEGCEGWAMIPNDPESIEWHSKGRP